MLAFVVRIGMARLVWPGGGSSLCHSSIKTTQRHTWQMLQSRGPGTSAAEMSLSGGV